jgi:hypothetical protein
MDALRPTAANVARTHIPSKGLPAPHEASRCRKGDPIHVGEAKPSPNSFAPVHPTSTATLTSPAKVGGKGAPPSTVSSSPRRQQAPTQALPAFLSRRPTVPVVAAEPVVQPALQTAPLAKSDSDDDAVDGVPSHGTTLADLGDGDLIDEALFEECLDLEEEEQTEEDLKAIAEDLSATTGLSHAEVLELLLEQQREKQALRRDRLSAKRDADTLRALVKKPPVVSASNDDGAVFVTATPDLVRAVHPTAAFRPVPPPLSSEFPAVPVPKVVPMSLPRTVEIDDDGEDGVADGHGQESSARRMKRQLAELFPAMSQSTQRSAAPPKEDVFVDLQTYRAQRAAKQHAAVASHLSNTRGAVETPKSLETRDVFVKAYEGEMQKRRAAKQERDDMVRRQKEEEDKERRMKGFFSNETIRKNIEEKQQKAKQSDTQPLPSTGSTRLRSSSRPSK